MRKVFATRVWGAEVKANLALAAPLVLANIGQSMNFAVGLAILGWSGSNQLVAGAMGTTLLTTVLVFGIGLVSAVSPLVAAECRAAGSVIRLKLAVRNACWAAAAYSALALLLLWNAASVFSLFTSDSKAIREAASFVATAQWGILPFLLLTVLRQVAASIGLPSLAVPVIFAGVVLNGCLSYFLLFHTVTFGKTAAAGLSNTFTNVVMLAAFVVIFCRNRRLRRYGLLNSIFSRLPGDFGAFLRIGAPIGAILILEVSMFNFALLAMAAFGTAAVAAHAIAMQIATLLFMIPLGISQAATIRVSLALSSRDATGVGIAGWTSLGLTAFLMGGASLLLFAWPRHLAGLFLDPGNPENAAVLQLAVSFLGIAGLFQLFDGLQAVGAGVLRGLQDTKVPMFYALFGYWFVGIGTWYILSVNGEWQGLGIWASLALALAVVSILMIRRWSRREEIGLVLQHLRPCLTKPATPMNCGMSPPAHLIC